MSKIKEVREKKLNNDELNAEEAVLDDLFYDLYRNRARVYRVNFVRGIFFGLGSFLGGTVVIALVVMLLTWLANIFPPMSDFFNWIAGTFRK